MQNLLVLLLMASIGCLIVGLIKPTIFSRFIKGEITRKKIATIFGVTAVASFILFGIMADPPNNNKATQQPAVENTQAVTKNKNESPAPVAEKTKASVVATTTKTETKATPVTKQASTLAPAPSSTQVKQTDSQNTAPAPIETVSQKNAVKKAKSYLNYTAFSHDGLVAQLEYEQFSHADAVYGVDNSGANWNEQAAKKAKQYIEYSAFSRGSLIDQLTYDKFTQEQAEYGANAVGL